MTDDFVPEADVVEQHQAVAPDDGEGVDVPERPVEATEADVLDQAQVLPDDGGYDGG